MTLRLLAMLLILLLIVTINTPRLTSEFSQLEIILDIQRDGSVIVTHIINVTELRVFIDVQALAKPLEPILAVGRELYDTSVEVINGKYVIRVYAPDVGIVNVTYVTDVLVTRTPPNVWTIKVGSSYTMRVILPKDSIPLEIPEGFISLYEYDDRYVIVLPPGDYEVKWLLMIHPPILIAKAEIVDLRYPTEVLSGSNFTLSIRLMNVGNKSGIFFITIHDRFRGMLLNKTTFSLGVGETIDLKFKIISPKVSENIIYALEVICGHDNITDDKITINIKVFVRRLIPKIELLEVKMKERVTSGEKYSIIIILVNKGNRSATTFIRLYDKKRKIKLFYDERPLKPGEKLPFEVELSAPSVDRETILELLLEYGYEGKVVETRTLIIHVLPKYYNYTTWIIVGVIALILAISVSLILIRLRRKRENTELKYILTDVDVEIIRLLQSRSGELLQREIVSTLGLPKTTIHRHLKKLEKYNIIKIEKIGAINIVRLIKRLKV